MILREVFYVTSGAVGSFLSESHIDRMRCFDLVIDQQFFGRVQGPLPSRELTYPTWGKGKSSSKVWDGGMLVPRSILNFWGPFFVNIHMLKYDDKNTP